MMRFRITKPRGILSSCKGSVRARIRSFRSLGPLPDIQWILDVRSELHGRAVGYPEVTAAKRGSRSNPVPLWNSWR
jgi:hypothetical protein